MTLEQQIQQDKIHQEIIDEYKRDIKLESCKASIFLSLAVGVGTYFCLGMKEEIVLDEADKLRLAQEVKAELLEKAVPIDERIYTKRFTFEGDTVHQESARTVRYFVPFD